ncbi:unnamed protein product [Gemmata massiliana]|uniref:Uncharacterized protein n=1 Tax=Gemmata massiliana TaxID=1210884 RepID=A0A6P2CT83_9BACT|nr:unnamed protein product [Gemmata massiliana]
MALEVIYCYDLAEVGKKGYERSNYSSSGQGSGYGRGYGLLLWLWVTVRVVVIAILVYYSFLPYF